MATGESYEHLGVTGYDAAGHAHGAQLRLPSIDSVSVFSDVPNQKKNKKNPKKNRSVRVRFAASHHARSDKPRDWFDCCCTLDLCPCDLQLADLEIVHPTSHANEPMEPSAVR